MGDLIIFSYYFRISGLEGLLSSMPGTRNHKHVGGFVDCIAICGKIGCSTPSLRGSQPIMTR